MDKTEGYSVRCIKNEIAKTPITKTVITDESEFIVDPRDGNKYKIVRLENQVWMAENLKATKFNDNTEIPLVIDKIAWRRFLNPAYCWYENQEAYSTYGALYNWHAVNSGKLCPTGWHVPSDEEWTTLVNRFGGMTSAGDALKESGTLHWGRPAIGGIVSNFDALPGGIRNELGEFDEIGETGYWWSYLKAQKPAGIYRIMSFTSSFVNSRNFKDKPVGLSVRCIKD